MNYLMPNQYGEILYRAIGLEVSQIVNLFRSEYLTYKEHNPNFISELGRAIIELEKKFHDTVNNLKGNYYTQDGQIPELEFNLMSFPIGEIFPNADFDNRNLNYSTVESVSKGWVEFKETVENSDTTISKDSNSTVKIKWEGQKNQLYSVIRQLKNDYSLITNSYDELAEFIVNNFYGFTPSNRRTVETELKKEQNLPKRKRVKINPDKED